MKSHLGSALVLALVASLGLPEPYRAHREIVATRKLDEEPEPVPAPPDPLELSGRTLNQTRGSGQRFRNIDLPAESPRDRDVGGGGGDRAAAELLRAERARRKAEAWARRQPKGL